MQVLDKNFKRFLYYNKPCTFVLLNSTKAPCIEERPYYQNIDEEICQTTEQRDIMFFYISEFRESKLNY